MAIGAAMHGKPILYLWLKFNKNGYFGTSGLCFHRVMDAPLVVVGECVAVRSHGKIGAIGEAHRKIVAGENIRFFAIGFSDKK